MKTDYDKAGEMKKNLVLATSKLYLPEWVIYEDKKFSVTSRHRFVLITRPIPWSIKRVYNIYAYIIRVHILSVLWLTLTELLKIIFVF